MAISFRNFQSLDSNAGLLWFSFALDGTNDPSVIYGRGVTSVVRNGVGNFTVTLNATYPVIRGVVATPNLGTTASADYTVTVLNGGFDGSVSSFDVQLNLAGVAADVATGAGFTIVCIVPYSTYLMDQVAVDNS